MKIVEGTVVRAKAGRDDKRLFVVTQICSDGYVMISDGKTRKLASPKKKNIKHLSFTSAVIDLNEITDKKLKMILGNESFPGNESEV